MRVDSGCDHGRLASAVIALVCGLTPAWAVIEPDWTVDSGQSSAEYGRSVAPAGDVNGDGFGDVIVGAWTYEHGEVDEGRAFVYLGSHAGLSSSADWTAESDQAGAQFGLPVAAAGDVNGDGYDDVIVGARHYDNGEEDEGRVFVYLGSAAGLSGTADWTAEGNQANAWFGYSVGSAGDVNGDGYGDVIVGAYSYDNGHTNEGCAFVYLGSAQGLSDTPAWTAESDHAYAYFGHSVASAGDVNGDGYGDIIVGADGYDNMRGRAYVYFGSATGLSSTSSWTAESDSAPAWFGGSVASAGDVNGDGYDDVIVGAPMYSNGQAWEGAAFVYFGSRYGLATTAAWVVESDQAYAQFGHSVAGAGDMIGLGHRNGYGSVIIGAPAYDNGEGDEGAVFVYFGSPTGLSPAVDWAAESDQASAWFGYSVSAAGDVNGDGYGEVIIGALSYDDGETDEGRAFVYPGSGHGLPALNTFGLVLLVITIAGIFARRALAAHS